MMTKSVAARWAEGLSDAEIEASIRVFEPVMKRSDLTDELREHAQTSLDAVLEERKKRNPEQ